MFSLQAKLRPPADEHPTARDALGMVILLGLALVFWPFWRVPAMRYLDDVPGQMASFYLLPALGLALALRRGALDLSVWATASLGGLAAAWVINAGGGPAWGFAAACGAGLGVGLFNAALVALARVPSWAATAVAALAILWATQAAVSGREVAVPTDAFARWQLHRTVRTAPGNGSPAPGQDEGMEEEHYPLQVTRMLVVVAFYAAVMMTLIAAEWFRTARGDKPGPDGGTAGEQVEARSPRAPRPRLWLFLALAASGLLAGAAGPCWLIDYGVAPVLRWPIGDLRVVAAAVLAGAAFFAAPHRTLLVGLCLPAALLLATVWRQHVTVWDLTVGGCYPQVAQFIVMLAGTQAAMGWLLSRRGGRLWPALAAAGATLGLFITAGASRAVRLGPMTAITIVGIVVWAAGVAIMIVSRLRTRRTPRPVESAQSPC